MKIKITADSTCDLPKSIRDQYDFDVLPLNVSLGEDNFADGETIVPDDIYRYYKETKCLPKTASRSIEDFERFFAKYVDEGYAVIHFSISSEMSSSYNNALNASKKFENVFVVDSKSLSTGTALLMMYASELVQKGLEINEIFDKVQNRVDYVQASFVVDELEFLHKGGRCSSLSYYMANILGIRPGIVVSEGKMSVDKKYIGGHKRCIRKYIDDTIERFDNPDKKRCFITHTKVDDELLDFAINQVKSYGIFDEVLETTAGCTVTTHCGEGTLGILYINDGGEKKLKDVNR